MTHDELKDKIYWHWRNAYPDGLTAMTDYRRMVLAVVELHEPDKFGFCYCSDIPSKCPTIQAIEAELK